MNGLRRQLVLLAVAVQFLSRLPTPRMRRFTPDLPIRAARYFPVVGWIVGAISAGVWLLALRAWSPLLSAVLATASAMLVTGAFHEDGLADTADGLGGGQTAARRLEIMKDSRIGAFGALALALSVATRVGALAGMSPWAGALALFTAHSAARTAAVIAMAVTPYVGAVDAAKGRAAASRPAAGEIGVAALLGFAPLALLPGRAALLAGVLLTITTGALMMTSRRLIGGHTGDVLGGVEQVAECAVLLGAAASL